MYKMQFVLTLVLLYIGLAHSWDIAVSMGDELQFYTNETKTSTVSFDSQILSALAHDEMHNMLLYVNKQSNNDTICGFNLSTMKYKYITEANGRNIQGLAFDPATELLFFSDATEKSINWISLKPGANNNIYGNLLVKMDDGIPTGVAVDSCRGFVYWINTNLTTPTIERARFNGSERAVVINLNSVTVNATYTMEPHSLTIDQQTQKMYWVEPVEPFMYKTYSANLNGRNIGTDIDFNFNSVDTVLRNPSNVLTVSNTSLIFWDWGKNNTVWDEPKTRGLVKELFKVETEVPIGIVANYKIADQVLGLTNCDALKGLVPNFSVSNHSLKLTRTKEYDGPFCVNGAKDIGQSRCRCTPGYIGERCDVSVCTNYCLHGSCSLNDEGLPICSCYAGYTGKRCEVDACYCYCMNDGNCSLNEVDAPICQCGGNHEGSRRESVSPTVHNITHLTLVDLLSKWRKPNAKVTVTFEV